MNESFMLGITAVTPLLVFMLTGYIFRARGLFSTVTFSEINKVVFWFFQPAILFSNVCKSNFKADFNMKLLIFAMAATLVIFILSCFVVNMFSKAPTEAPVLIHGLFRSNFVLLGLSITESIYGSDGIGMATIMVAAIVPLYNFMAVVLFERYRCKSVSFSRIVKGVLKNPMILATIFGIILKMSTLEIPEVGMNIVSDIGKLAMPLALISLGGTITFAGLKKYRIQVMMCSLGRLVLIPALFVLVGIGMGFRNSDLMALLVMLASPTAVTTFSVASEMGGDKELAAILVVMTSIFSVITIFGWIFLLNMNGFI